MIKILGLLKNKKIKCRMCKCKYTYDSEDVSWYSGILRGVVECPICKYENNI